MIFLLLITLLSCNKVEPLNKVYKLHSTPTITSVVQHCVAVAKELLIEEIEEKENYAVQQAQKPVPPHRPLARPKRKRRSFSRRENIPGCKLQSATKSLNDQYIQSSESHYFSIIMKQTHGGKRISINVTKMERTYQTTPFSDRCIEIMRESVVLLDIANLYYEEQAKQMAKEEQQKQKKADLEKVQEADIAIIKDKMSNIITMISNQTPDVARQNLYSYRQHIIEHQKSWKQTWIDSCSTITNKELLSQMEVKAVMDTNMNLQYYVGCQYDGEEICHCIPRVQEE